MLPGDLGVIGCSLAAVDPDTYIVLTQDGVVDAQGAAPGVPRGRHLGNPLPPTASIVLPNGDRVGKYDQLDDAFVPTTTDWVRLSPARPWPRPWSACRRGRRRPWDLLRRGAVDQRALAGRRGNPPDPDEIWKLEFGGDIGPIAIDKPGERCW
ncbi:MAG: hypothetical protein U0168_16165 [Nannocystaceae bacterium]